MSSTPLEILSKYWGYTAFKPSQDEVIRKALIGEDVLALLPTGGGKSLCFQVPALIKEGICVVICPLIALMNDQINELKRVGIKAEKISSGMSPRQIDITLDNCVYGDIKFLYISPERIKSLFVQARLKLMNINYIAVDEAHCISQWGHDFRPAFKEIYTLKELAPDASIIAVTATATKKVANDIQLQLNFTKSNIVRSSFSRKNIYYQSIHSENKLNIIKHELKNFKECGIVYIRSRKQCESIAKELNHVGVSAEYYHAGIDVEERKKVEARWKDNKTNVIVSTSAFGMGINKSDVRLVVHFGLPSTLEEYYQESGRAGRDGKPARALIIFNREDILNNRKMLLYRFPERIKLKQVYQNLGNYSQIAVGAGENEGFSFDINEFSKRFDIHPLSCHYSINVLENAGYIFTSEESNASSKLKILQDRYEIDEIVRQNTFQSKLLSMLLRSYTNLFTNYVNISESDLASRLETSVDKIKKGLHIMEQTKVVHYKALSYLPSIIYSIPRVKTKLLSIPKELLEDRKAVANEQLESMVEFATIQKKCRTNVALFYFNETPTDQCGNCDNCINHSSEGDIVQFLRKTLANNSMELTHLVNLSNFSREETIKTIRELMDKGIIIRDDQFLKLK